MNRTPYYYTTPYKSLDKAIKRLELFLRGVKEGKKLDNLRGHSLLHVFSSLADLKGLQRRSDNLHLERPHLGAKVLP